MGPLCSRSIAVGSSFFHYADDEGVFYEDWGLALIWGEVWISPFSYDNCPWM